MLMLHTLSFYLHIVCGAAALLVFWLPVFATKGGSLHRHSGRWFARGMYAVSVSALIMSTLVLVDPIGIRHPDGNAANVAQAAAGYRATALFLLLLALLVLASVRHSLLALRGQQDRAGLRRPAHLLLLALLGVLGIAVVALGAHHRQILLLIFGTLSAALSAGMLRYTLRAETGPRDWLIEHLSGMIGAGIGAYTAFFAFGGSRLLAGLLPGQWQVIPWVVPAIIGSFAIRTLARRYRVRRGRAAEPGHADQQSGSRWRFSAASGGRPTRARTRTAAGRSA